MQDAHVIHRFVRGFRGRHLRWSVALVVLGQALPVAVALCILELLLPSWLGVFAVAGGLWVLACGLQAWLRHRSPLARVDHELGLRDRLLTYLGLERRGVAPVLAPWLAHDLAARLAAVPEERRAVLWRRPLGRARYLLPVLILLLLLRQFAPLPAWPGQSGPPLAEQGGGGGGGGQGQGQGKPEPTPGSDDAAPAPPAATSPPDTAPPPIPDPPEPPPPEQTALLPEPPAAEVRVVEEFVVPSFVGDGETRRQLSRLAVVAAVAEPAGPAPQPAPRPGDAPGPDPAADPDLTYERALELAVRARHVPLAERPFVRAYFETLVETAR